MNEIRNLHPAGARLDAVATGDADAEAAAHVVLCAECSAYLARLRAQIETFARAEAERPDGFVEAALRERASRGRQRRFARRMAAATSGLALAAGLLLFVHFTRPHPRIDLPAETTEGPIRFKGGSQVAVIVDHDGAQTRETGTLRVAPGDRIRVEIALDHDDEVVAGVLADAGDWVELQGPARLRAGTHFLEGAVAFHQPVDEGWILVGPPAAVGRARATHDFAAVHAIRIHAAVP